jgi:hypothetical protein
LTAELRYGDFAYTRKLPHMIRDAAHRASRRQR